MDRPTDHHLAARPTCISVPEKEIAMTYDLVIGDRGYSSWSLRGWLLFDAFGIPVKTHLARLYSDELPTLLKSCRRR